MQSPVEKVALRLRPNPKFQARTTARDKILQEYRIASGRRRVPKAEHIRIIDAVKAIWKKQDTRRSVEVGYFERMRLAKYQWLSELPLHIRAERIHHLRSARLAWLKRLAPRQIAHLSDDVVLDLAPICLHAENRRAKHLRGVRTATYEIYDVKNAYLEAAVVSGQFDRVERFERTSEREVGWECYCCGREWSGRSDFCYGCRDASCTGVLTVVESKTWYIVQIASYRFHQPGDRCNCTVFDRHALAVRPHDPTQEIRDVPETGYSRYANLEIVRRATLLLGQGSRKQGVGDAA